MTLEIGALIIQEFVVGGRKIFGKFACSDTDIWLQCSAFTGQDRGCGRLLRCCIIIPCLRSLKRRDTWPDIRRIAQLSSSTVTLTPLCGQCRTQLSHITAHCRENILTLHHLHWIWKHAKDPTQSLAWLNIHWSCCKTGYDDTYSYCRILFTCLLHWYDDRWQNWTKCVNFISLQLRMITISWSLCWAPGVTVRVLPGCRLGDHWSAPLCVS